MQHYPEERSRARSQGAGRFTQRNGYPDSNTLRAQQVLEHQAMMASRGSITPPRQQARRNTAPIVEENERLKRAVKNYQDQLALADDAIYQMKKKERDKATQDLKTHVELGGRFESLTQGAIRPTQIIEKYGLLYTQGRIDAMDDLDQIAGLSKYGKHQEMKQKILFGIVVASYKVSHDYLIQVKSNLHKLLCIPDKHPPTEKDAYGEALTFLTTYFQSTTQTYSVDPIIKDVQDQLVQLLPEFPSLSRLPGIAAFTADCCHLCWSMVNQIPPMELEHSQDKFLPVMHTRFHASSDKNLKVKMYVWPTLVDAGNKNILCKGVVWT